MAVHFYEILKLAVRLLRPRSGTRRLKNDIYMQREGCGKVWIIGLIRAKVKGDAMFLFHTLVVAC